MNKISGLLALLMILLAACHHSGTGFKKGPGDFFYRIVEPNNGDRIRPGDFIWLSYAAFTAENKKVTGSFFAARRPIELLLQKPDFKGDLYTGLALLSAGDSAVFKVSIDSMIKYKQLRRRPVTHGKYLQYQVKLYRVITRGKMSDDQLMAEIEVENARQVAGAKASEPAEIGHYLAAGRVAFRQTASCLYYYAGKSTAGPKAAGGDTVRFYYTIRSLLNEVVETNDLAVARQAGIYDQAEIAERIKCLKNEPEGEEMISSLLSNYQPTKVVIDADPGNTVMNEALKLFPAGTSCTLVVPSRLSYQGQPYRTLAPYTPVRCDIRIISIMKRK